MYYDDWKYEPTGYDLTKAEEQYEKILKDYPKTYEELIPISLEHAKKIESRMKDNWFSHYHFFRFSLNIRLEIWYTICMIAQKLKKHLMTQKGLLCKNVSLQLLLNYMKSIMLI